jgi:hypothetical protein
VFKELARTFERESRRKRREFAIIVFRRNVSVKGNRKALLCKRGMTPAKNTGLKTGHYKTRAARLRWQALLADQNGNFL